MNWRRIPKESTPLPAHGSTYSDWKPELSEEGFHQCVYCTISESSFGGIRNFHVEHYMPKGIARFAVLKDVFSNLFYACAICNTFKSDDWPADPVEDCSIDCFPNPSIKNYGELFNVDRTTALLNGRNITGTYILNKLYLNRPQLIINRKEHIAEENYQRLINEVKDQKKTLFEMVTNGNHKALQFLKQLDIAVEGLEAVFHLKDTTIPYTTQHTKKTASKR